MNDPDRLQALFDALAQPATPSELADEAQTVDVVARAISVSKGNTMQIPATSGRLRVASFLAAGIIGFGGVAAAGPAVLDSVTGGDDPAIEDLVADSIAPDVSLPETTVPTTEPEITTTTEPEATTTTVAAATGDDGADGETGDDGETGEDGLGEDGDVSTAELVDDPDTAFDETECAEGNHGKTVSSVAKATPSGPGKGAIVSEAAHSSCGKKDKSDKDADDADDDDDDADADADADDADADDDDADDDDDDADEDDADDDDDDDDEQDKVKDKKDKQVKKVKDKGSDRGNGNGKGKNG